MALQTSIPPEGALHLCIKRSRCFYLVFGLAPFSLDADCHEIHLVCRKRDRLCPAFWTLAIFAHFLYINWLVIYALQDLTTKTIIIFYINKILKFATAIMCVAPATLRKRTQLISIFSQIAFVDYNLKTEGRYPRIWPALICFLVSEVLFICCVIGTQAAYFSRDEVDWMFFCSLLSEAIIATFILLEFSQFIFMVLLLKRRFKALNDQLYFPLERAQSFSFLDCPFQISDLRQAYAHLYEASRKLGSHYGVPVLLGTGWCLSSIVGSLSRVTGNGLVDYMMVFYIGHACVAFSLITAICGTCHVTAKESMATRVLIQKLLLVKMENEMEKELEQFFNQTSVMKASFNAVQVVDIGLNLFCTVTGAAVTLVIFLYEMPD